MTTMKKAEILAECDRLDASGNYDSAMALLGKAIESYPNERDFWVNRGRLRCDRLANPSDAIADFQQAIACDPWSAIPHQYLSLCYQILGEAESAINHAERALDLDDGDAFSHYVVAKCRLSANRFHSATKHLELAVEIDEDSFLFWSSLGDAYLGASKIDKAIDAYERAYNLRPNPSLQIRLARIELDLGNVRKFLEHLDLASGFDLNESEQALVDGYREAAKRG